MSVYMESSLHISYHVCVPTLIRDHSLYCLIFLSLFARVHVLVIISVVALCAYIRIKSD